MLLITKKIIHLQIEKLNQIESLNFEINSKHQKKDTLTISFSQEIIKKNNSSILIGTDLSNFAQYHTKNLPETIKNIHINTNFYLNLGSMIIGGLLRIYKASKTNIHPYTIVISNLSPVSKKVAQMTHLADFFEIK